MNIGFLHEAEVNVSKQARNYKGSWDLDPRPFPQDDKSALFLLIRDLIIVIIKLESNEIREIPAILFLYLKSASKTEKILFQTISLLKNLQCAIFVD